MKLLTSIAIAGALIAGSTTVQAQDPITLGVLNDQSSLYAELHGPGSVVAAQMAIDDHGGKVKGRPIKLIFADHQNRPDVALEIARRWIDKEKVEAIIDVPNSAIALAIAGLTKQENKVLLDSGANTNRLTGDMCTPNTVHWTLDNWADINGTISALTKRGADTWFFLSVDAETGYDMERQSKPLLDERNAKIVGTVRYPLNTSDFSSFVLRAQASKAKVIAIAGGGDDVNNAVKQGFEYGLQGGGQIFAALAGYVTNVRGIGLPIAKGMVVTDAFYWDLNDQTRSFSARFEKLHKGKKPTSYQAGVYAAVLHYLKALEKVDNVSDGRAAVAAMRAMPIDDALFGKGSIREDGRAIHPMYVFEAKAPEDSKYPWDDMRLIDTIPADKAFKPLDPACPLVKKS